MRQDRDIAATDTYVAWSRARKKPEMLFAHLKRILKLDPPGHEGTKRRPRRVPARTRLPEPPDFARQDPPLELFVNGGRQ